MSKNNLPVRGRTQTGNGANLGFENQMWAAADKLRGHMDASEYKHVVLGLIFLKYISDAFQAKYKQLEATKDTEYTDPEDRDEYAATNIFWVPQEARWKYGIPPVNNANYAWIQHFIHHLSPTWVAGFVMANGSMSTNTTSEGEIRRNIIEADLVDCMIALPGQLFYTTQIPVCLWFLARNKVGAHGRSPLRDRRGQTLFIDARKLGSLIDRTHKDFSDEEIDKVTATYHAWRGVGADGHPPYQDVPGFCKSVTTNEIREHGYVLTPGRYVGAAEIEDDGVPFEEKMAELSATLYEQFAEADRLEATIKRNLEVLGYGE
ncbi:MAG: N-6 DNA methylase [Pseudomonadota bacterium]|nr:N-6 DNA methylase [Pseudomonadota bacterium]